MPDTKNQSAGNRHDRAREETEKALDAMVQGDDKRASEHVRQARRIDEAAVREVLDDLNEDADSDHSIPPPTPKR